MSQTKTGATSGIMLIYYKLLVVGNNAYNWDTYATVES